MLTSIALIKAPHFCSVGDGQPWEEQAVGEEHGLESLLGQNCGQLAAGGRSGTTAEPVVTGSCPHNKAKRHEVAAGSG